MAARGALFVQAGEQRVLTLSALNLRNRLGCLLLEVGALVPNASQRMIAAFADRPYHDRHGPAAALDVQRRVVQTVARNKKEGTEIRVGLGFDPDRFTKRTCTKQRKIGVACGRPCIPEIPHVIACVKGILILRACRHVRCEALAGRFPFREIPKGDKSRNFCYGLDVLLPPISREEREND